MVEVLRGLGDSGFSLHRFFQCSNCGVGGDLEGEEVGIVVRGRGDIQSDAPLLC